MVAYRMCRVAASSRRTSRSLAQRVTPPAVCWQFSAVARVATVAELRFIDSGTEQRLTLVYCSCRVSPARILSYLESNACAKEGTSNCLRSRVRCVVCYSESERVVWTENGFEGRLCSCGTVYTVPPPPEEAIDITRDGHARLFYARYALMKARWVHRLRPGGRLLEIGCGEGDFLTAAKSLGYEVYGVEADSGRAHRASEWLRRPVRCATLDELRPPANGFDVIYHCDLLSHFPDPV